MIVVRTGGPRAVSRYAAAATLGLGVLAWVVAVQQTAGMDMGPATRLGSLPVFFGLWMPMMAAMMLPGAVPAVARLASADARITAVPQFVTLYLLVWATISLLVYELYRPHGYAAAGVVTIAAGFYELTPLKAYFRHRCQQNARSGLGFGLCCVGSTAGLMAMFLALGVMNVTWMGVVAGVVVVQKTLPTKTVVDVPLALAIVALGIFVIVAPSAVSRLAISM